MHQLSRDLNRLYGRLPYNWQEILTFRQIVFYDHSYRQMCLYSSRMRRTAHYADLEMKKYQLRSLENEEYQTLMRKDHTDIREKTSYTNQRSRLVTGDDTLIVFARGVDALEPIEGSSIGMGRPGTK